MATPEEINLMPKQGKARAVCVGINYIGTSSALKGCINDAENSLSKFNEMCASAGFDKPESRLLTDTGAIKPTRNEIIKAMYWLVDGAQPGDVMWFHYSGHGSQMQDRDGDEEDGKDECICPSDMKFISDDEIKKLLCGTLPEGSTMYAIFDCCHSGTMVDLHYVYDENSHALVRDTRNACTRGEIFMISGCLNVQTSADLPAGFAAGVKEDVGALTNTLLKYIDKGWSWDKLVPCVRKELVNTRLKQIPQFEVGRPEDVHAPAFNKLLPEDMRSTAAPCPVDTSELPPVSNVKIDEMLAAPPGPHDNDTDMFSASLAQFLEIAIGKGMAALGIKGDPKAYADQAAGVVRGLTGGGGGDGAGTKEAGKKKGGCGGIISMIMGMMKKKK